VTKVRSVLVALVLALGLASSAEANQVGQSRKVKDSKGHLMKLTVLTDVYAMESTNQFEHPRPGMQFYGLLIRVTNLSNARLDDCAGRDGTLTNKAGEAYTVANVAINARLRCYRLLPHRQVQGWIIFNVPLTDWPTYFDWTPNAGASADTADFNVCRFHCS
jgi:hypothetical protein